MADFILEDKIIDLKRVVSYTSEWAVKALMVLIQCSLVVLSHLQRECTLSSQWPTSDDSEHYLILVA